MATNGSLSNAKGYLQLVTYVLALAFHRVINLPTLIGLPNKQEI